MGDAASTKFTWKIDNFSKLAAKKLYSDIFIIRRCKWRLLILPKGNVNADHLSIYLEAAESTNLPNGWSRDVNFGLSVINHFNNKSTVRKDTKHVFNARECDWGFSTFIPLSKLKDTAARYLVNDTLTVEAEVQVHSVVHYSVPEPVKEVIKDEPKLPKPVQTPADQPTTVEPPAATVTAKPVNQTGGAVQTEAPIKKQEIVKESLPPPTIVDEKNLARDPPSISVPSSPDVEKISKNLVTEISNRTRTQKSIPNNEFPVPSQATNPELVHQKKEALLGFFNMSLEAIQQANAFRNIERIIIELANNTTITLQEKTILEDLASRLTEFQESIPNSTIVTETVKDRRISLAEKTANLNSRLEKRQKEISSLVEKFSRLSEEEAKLEAEIQRLMMRKEELVTQKKSAAVELQKANEGASRELEEWRGLEGEIKESNGEWRGAKEKLALANVRWKLFKEDLGLGNLNIS
ncbi:uncharacterized protein LOC126680213 [Mercurialis annua]|uniref:uncharacterized protein LOC126680213 n=1 Tax=Mercurialis annua TaxID=3986 RepID=UPI00216086BC|nr:uncharacterized protein LOC126680213 [Mercurialis annua]